MVSQSVMETDFYSFSLMVTNFVLVIIYVISVKGLQKLASTFYTLSVS